MPLTGRAVLGLRGGDGLPLYVGNRVRSATGERLYVILPVAGASSGRSPGRGAGMLALVRPRKPITGTEMKNSPYLDKPIAPLAVALRSMPAETGAKLATAAPTEKAWLQERAEVLREWIKPKSTRRSRPSGQLGRDRRSRSDDAIGYPTPRRCLWAAAISPGCKPSLWGFGLDEQLTRRANRRAPTRNGSCEPNGRTKMPSLFNNEALEWLDRAEQAQEVAGQLTDPAARNAILELADNFDRLAQTASGPTVARRRELARHK